MSVGRTKIKCTSDVVWCPSSTFSTCGDTRCPSFSCGGDGDGEDGESENSKEVYMGVPVRRVVPLGSSTTLYKDDAGNPPRRKG